MSKWVGFDEESMVEVLAEQNGVSRHSRLPSRRFDRRARVLAQLDLFDSLRSALGRQNDDFLENTLEQTRTLLESACKSGSSEGHPDSTPRSAPHEAGATLQVVALPELVELAAVRQLEGFCKSRVPEHARDEIRLAFVIRGSITLVERRAPWDPDYGTEWSRLKIAQLRYDADARAWSLYCRDRNERWFPYTEARAQRDLAPLLEVVDKDPTGIFWG